MKLQQDFLPGEIEAVRIVQNLALEFGYGNLIAHMRRYWALWLMAGNDKLDYETALQATNVSPYPEKFPPF